MTSATYIIGSDGKWITCLRCGMTSHNSSDVRNRYCGNCHLFHIDPGPLVGCALSIYRPGQPEPEIVNVRMAKRPSLDELHAIIDPYLEIDGEKRNLEHVNVLFNGTPHDMFVDECGVLDELPRNEAATAIYRANWLDMHPDDDPESLPHIAGVALVFWRKVWS
jgi:hypothetical protein